MGVLLLSRGKSTFPFPPFLVLPLTLRRVLGNGKGWLEMGRGTCFSDLNGNAALVGKGMVGTARSEKPSVGFLFLWSCLLGEEALGEVFWSWGFEPPCTSHSSNKVTLGCSPF